MTLWTESQHIPRTGKNPFIEWYYNLPFYAKDTNGLRLKKSDSYVFENSKYQQRTDQ